jgi:hypothetical protein
MTDDPRDTTSPPAPAESPGAVGPDASAPPPRSRSLTRSVVVGALLLGAGLAIVVLILPRWLGRPAAPATDVEAPAAAPDARRIKATLFYVSEDGTELVPVSRDVPYGATAIEQAQRILEAQLGPASHVLPSAIPAGTNVRGLFLGANGEAYVDLSAEVVTGLAGGFLSEALAVFTIVNAVTVNLPDVTAVQILVDGKEVDSLAGHLDLREPIRRASDWIRKGQ